MRVLAAAIASLVVAIVVIFKSSAVLVLRRILEEKDFTNFFVLGNASRPGPFVPSETAFYLKLPPDDG